MWRISVVRRGRRGFAGGGLAGRIVAAMTAMTATTDADCHMSEQPTQDSLLGLWRMRSANFGTIVRRNVGAGVVLLLAAKFVATRFFVLTGVRFMTGRVGCVMFVARRQRLKLLFGETGQVNIFSYSLQENAGST